MKDFVFNLYAQVRVLRDQLLRHPRFQWTAVDREKLEEDGRKGGAVDIALLPRIVQCCENEVLGIMHREFYLDGWKVRAKIFDGLIVERGEATADLSAALRLVETACHRRGWDIRLIEKPLHGKQDDAIQTVVTARAAIKAAKDELSIP